jgi:hypothetical protein
MKKKIIITISVFLLLLVLIISYKALVKKKISMILPDKIVEMFGERVLSGGGWENVSIECRKGGFDILSYAGKDIVIQRSLAIGKFYNLTPLNINKIYAGDKIICEYYTDSLGLLAPGIFAINDPNVTGQ